MQSNARMIHELRYISETMDQTKKYTKKDDKGRKPLLKKERGCCDQATD